MAKTRVRKGMPSVAITKAEFTRRARERFVDPAFDGLQDEIGRIINAAWDGYHDYRKSPRTHKAGDGFADPSFELSVDWRRAHEAIRRAQRAHRSSASPSRILLVNGSSRSDQTCPGEMSKTFRLVELARRQIERARGFAVEVLDLSLLASQYGRQILPCKACVSTAMPLCHWPCSCYPNHALGQVNDWMADIYPMWVAAHGVMIVTPVNWYQAPSGLKAMMDRLVCADGGNPDPTTTRGKDPAMAKAIELKGWDYPRHLAGRIFSVVVHGDAAGTETLRRILADWLTDMGLIGAGHAALLDRTIGYYRPYATSHDDLDADHAFQAEVRNAARALVQAVRLMRSGKLAQPDARLAEIRPK
ncbi:MAG: flavodoxin family protein [Reyranella sp.]|uniref:flavodoxin family protein n=1 Tax=Reyranella sp. TaxID=1929291 RepID=UPI003D0DDEFF